MSAGGGWCTDHTGASVRGRGGVLVLLIIIISSSVGECWRTAY